MSEDFISLKMLIVSEAAAERELVRRAALQASVMIDVKEVAAAGDAKAVLEALKQDNFDAIFLDSRMPKASRQEVLDAARTADGRPLTILIGAAEMKTREVLTEGLAVDGVLAKPIEMGELESLLANCVRARLPNRALIVDDSSTVRSVIRKVLQASRFRFEADEADDGAAAIELAAKQHFDMIFLDCNMPGLDGFATLSEIRRTRPSTKVVMMTGTRDARIEDRAHAEGARDFLYKPFFAKDIDAVLNRLFGLMRPRWN
jgi:CheY-like chemotaxis protein